METCTPQVIEDPEKVKLLVDETRQAIICSLAENSMSLSQLARKLNKTPATIHFHIKKLENVGFVKLQKTEIVNNNLTEKFYALAVPPCIVGLGVNINLRGPVPPKAYKLMRTKLKPFLEQIITQNGGKKGKEERKLIKDIEKVVNEVVSESEVTFREMLAQLNLNLSLQDRRRIERLVSTLPLFALCQLLCKSERRILLDKVIQRMPKTFYYPIK